MNEFLHAAVDLFTLAKDITPWGAACIVLVGVLHLIRALRQPRALANAVKSMETQKEKDALVEMYRIANQSKSKSKKKRPPSDQK